MDIASLVTDILVFMPPFLFSLVFHEYAHAVVAARLGGYVRDWEQRKTLDPMAHLDPVGSLLFPILGIALGGFVFGWAKPVYWMPDIKADHRRDGMLVALAGPVSNLVLMFLFAALLRIWLAVGLGGSTPPLSFVGEMLWAGIFVNAILALFNMLPLPPLDGSKVLAFFLSPYDARRLLSISPTAGLVIVLLMVNFGVLRWPMRLLMGLAGWLAGTGT